MLQRDPTLPIADSPLSDKVECTDVCRGYHTAWPWLRQLGVISGANVVQAYCERREQTAFSRAKRILIAGCADEGLLENLCGALGARAQQVDITVCDLCATPLHRCTALAEKSGLSITCQTANLLDLDIAGQFDLIVGHSILSFFPREKRRRFFEGIAARLTDGGTIYLFQAVRDGVDGSEVRFDASEGQQFKARAMSAFREQGAPMVEETFIALVDRFVETRRGVLVSNLDHVLASAADAGLVAARVERYDDGHKSANLVANRRTMVLHLRKGPA